MRKLTRVLLTVVLTASAVGCDTGNTLPTATPGGGFFIETRIKESGIVYIEPGVGIIGNWVADLPGAAGDPSSWTKISNPQGLISVVGGRAPATWKGTWVSDIGLGDACNGFSAQGPVAVGKISHITCEPPSSVPQVIASPFTLSPNPINTTAPPSSVTVTGEGLNTTYGLPLIQYYDLNGNLVAQENATSVSSPTAMVVSGGGISHLPVGTYAGYVSNAGPNGTWNYVGTGSLQVADGWVTIDGWEQSAEVCVHPLAGGDCSSYGTRYDSGTISITTNGFTVSTSYGQNSTSTTIASALAAAFNGNSSSPVTASANRTVVLLFTKTAGTYPLSATSANSSLALQNLFGGPSFNAWVSASTY